MAKFKQTRPLVEQLSPAERAQIVGADIETCWCGDERRGHGWNAGHSFVPMGCDCMRQQAANWCPRKIDP